ncbi:hypothetical protein GCK72_015349 [Caenorhabditis remanei]|uniref:Uncharacterized protein n=1 Tax=Caenorhabditis remanei TaxID=31234 RepID=A0A6A5GWG1_CAERE|nr:hypothetical protein GCK72_015349 [Caenorhabditis remanei]KAF1758889.1 hypothetical protein GCK72_015349 [Caenorhabditis remanei]
MTSSPTSSDSSLEEEKFLKPEDVEECIPPKELEMMIEEKKVGTLDDFVTLRWYCMLVLLMAELTAFTATASSKVMVFAESSLAIVVFISPSSCPNTSGTPCIVYFNISRLRCIQSETSSSWVSGSSENSWPNGEWALIEDGYIARFSRNCQEKKKGKLDESHCWNIVIVKKRKVVRGKKLN